ncbi:transposase [Streptomyces sp. NPDC002599]|uniref:transposase n=1 Tax=Streptomyces sp. NPDC002599 TaxID=3154421 RepID=UPI0033176D1B
MLAATAAAARSSANTSPPSVRAPPNRSGPTFPAPARSPRGSCGPGRPSPRARTSDSFKSGSPAQTSPAPAISPAPSPTWSVIGMDYLLMEWIRQAEQDAPKPMKGFAGFLRQDLDAVTAGLTLPWSSGVVEGHINRVKTLKRAMYGRASFELLRSRILTQSRPSATAGRAVSKL